MHVGFLFRLANQGGSIYIFLNHKEKAMQQIPIAQKIKKMKPAQRLILVQKMWDSIARDKPQVSFTS